MRRMLMVLVTGMTLGLSTLALAADPPPDCSEKQKGVDDAKAAAKAASAKPDVSSCKDMKGKEKTDCETPIKTKAKDDSKAAKDKVKEAQNALACCKNPKKKGCTP